MLSDMQDEGARRRDGQRQKTHAERLASRDGYFAPESVIRRLGNSPLIPFLGGGPAVLLQLAHPLVAAGIAEHSDYRRHFWRRFIHTLQALYLIVYGSKAEADEAAATVRAVHAHVKGWTSRPLGPFPAGTRYSAADPELMLWVHATLVESSLAVQHRLLGRLTAAEAESYYREMAVVARIFGVPKPVIPDTLSDFRAYMSAQLAGPEICVTEPAREVAAVILEAPLPAPLRLVVPAHRLASAGLLPARLRAEYGLRWSPAHAVALALAARSLRVVVVPLFIAAERISPSVPAYAI